MTIKKQISSGLKWSAASKAASQVVSWLATIFVIHLLAPSDYGLMAMATVVIAFLSTFHEFGLGSALIQSRELDDETTGAVYGAMLLLGILLSSLLAATSWWIAQFFDEPRLQTLIAVAGLQFVLSSVTIVPESILRRNMLFKYLGLADLLSAIVASLSTLALALLGHGVWSLVLGNMLGALVRALALIAANTRKVDPNLRLRSAFRLISFGANITAARFIAYFMSQSDVLIGAKLLGKETLGLYTVALQLASLPMDKAMGTVNQVAFSAIARMQDQHLAVQHGLKKAIRLLAYLALPAIFGLASVAPEFVHLVLGQKWSGAVLPLQLVALVIPIRMLSGLLFTAINGLGHANVGLKNTLTGAVILPVCFYIGAQSGVNGLAAAWVIGAPAVFAMNFTRTRTVTGLGAKELVAAISIPLLASLLMVISILTIRQLVPVTEMAWIGLFLLMFSGAVVYCVVLFLCDSELRREVNSTPWARRIRAQVDCRLKRNK